MGNEAYPLSPEPFASCHSDLASECNEEEGEESRSAQGKLREGPGTAIPEKPNSKSEIRNTKQCKRAVSSQQSAVGSQYEADG